MANDRVNKFKAFQVIAALIDFQCCDNNNCGEAYHIAHMLTPDASCDECCVEKKKAFTLKKYEKFMRIYGYKNWKGA